jgi:hypothetical protein
MSEYVYEVIELDGCLNIKRTGPDDIVWWIPTDPDNSDYQEYLASLEATNSETE